MGILLTLCRSVFLFCLLFGFLFCFCSVCVWRCFCLGSLVHTIRGLATPKCPRYEFMCAHLACILTLCPVFRFLLCNNGLLA